MGKEYKFLDSDGLKNLTKEILSISGSGGNNHQNLITNEFDENDTNNNPTDKALSSNKLHDVLYELYQRINNKFSTKLDTKNAIQNIINSAPEALDTLKELADALGNDANFASTVTNKLTAKADKIETETKLNNKLDKTGKAADSELLDGLDSIKFTRSYGLMNGENIPREVFRNIKHNQAYIGMINYGTEDGLSSNHAKIIYMPHNTDGYGSQIAIQYDSGQYYGILYRQANGTQWLGWCELLDGRDCNQNYPGRIAPGNDANNCLDSGKAYYCIWNQTKNLPLGDNLDDGIIIPYMHIREQYGFQLYMTWNSTAIYWRKKHVGNWSKWYCIGGGSWNQEVIKDSEQVFQYMRWKYYGQNHVIFDASQGIRPDGQPCDKINPQKGWHEAICPTLMGFNGSHTWGVRVSNAGWADGAGGVQGFAFRNNNGILEFFEQGVWKAVSGGGGGMGYTVVRQGDIYGNHRFDYSGGPGILRKIIMHRQVSSGNRCELYIDGVKIDSIQYFQLSTVNSNNQHMLELNMEFKNSISILNTDTSPSVNVSYIVQTLQ